MRERIERIVQRLDEQGVEVAVMPELTLDNALLERWVAVVRQPPPRGSRLRLILVGAGPLKARASLLLAPVLSKPMLLHFWEHSDAKKWATEVGSNTVAANSLVVEASMRQSEILDPGALGTALAHSPTVEYTHGHAPSPEDVSHVLALTGLAPVMAAIGAALFERRDVL
jgi:hypothetical protein